MKIIQKSTLFILLLSVFWAGCSAPFPRAKRVILIGIDGMSVDGFQQARTPNLDALVRQGALSLNTRAVMPTVSAPNWASHLLGAGPEEHGVTANGWTVTNHSVEPTISDEDGFFPSIFEVIREHRPKAKTGMFYDWKALADLINFKYIDTVAFSDSLPVTLKKSTSWIIAEKPDFTFIYAGLVDEAGHSHGWMSKKYIEAIENVDSQLGDFFKALKDAKLFDDTYFLVVTDHGGSGYSHGGLSMNEIEVPWIISGPGIIKNRMINLPNDVFNTASTIAFLFGLRQPSAWIGRPVMDAFKGSFESKDNRTIYVPQPYSSVKSGLYTKDVAVTFNASEPDMTIRFTTDGKDPDASSHQYKDPLLLLKSTLIKAAGFKGDERSRITTIDIIRVIPVKNLELKEKPAEKYASAGDSILVDLQRGSADYKDGKWLGFQGTDLDATIDLGKIEAVRKISIGFLDNPDSWIFPPEDISIEASVDGKRWVVTGKLNENQIEGEINPGRNEISVPVEPFKSRFLRIIAKNTGTCPPGHPGMGKPAWLFADEIIIE